VTRAATAQGHRQQPAFALAFASLGQSAAWVHSGWLGTEPAASATTDSAIHLRPGFALHTCHHIFFTCGLRLGALHLRLSACPARIPHMGNQLRGCIPGGWLKACHIFGTQVLLSSVNTCMHSALWLHSFLLKTLHRLPHLQDTTLQCMRSALRPAYLCLGPCMAYHIYNI